MCRVLPQFSLLSSSALQSVNIPDALCYEDEDCPAGQAVVAGNGKERDPPPVHLLVEAGSFRDGPGYNPGELWLQTATIISFSLRQFLVYSSLMAGQKAPRAAESSNNRGAFPAKRAFHSREEGLGWQWKASDFHLPCRQGEGAAALSDLFCAVCAAGVKTGRCLKDRDNIRGSCEVLAWCPVEKRSKPKYVAVLCCFQAWVAWLVCHSGWCLSSHCLFACLNIGCFRAGGSPAWPPTGLAPCSPAWLTGIPRAVSSCSVPPRLHAPH